MSILTRTDAPPASPDLSRTPRPPVFYWALVGAGFVALNLVIYVGWAFNGRWTATPTGSDPVPTAAKIGVWVFQILSCIAAVAAVTYVVRQCHRERRLTFDAAVLIGWVLASWQDPLLNLIRPAFFYNSYFFDLGGWAPQIPGWSSPRGGWLPEDIIGTAGVGYVWMVFVPIVSCALMRAARRRWPQIGPIGLFAVAFAWTGFFDFVVELYCVHIHLWAYPSAIHNLSIFGGSVEQFPIYETLFWGSVWAALALLRFNRDDSGNSAVEKGIDELGLSRQGTGVVRALAVTAFINVVFLVYSVIMIWTTLMPNTGHPAGYPSYLRDGLCGKDTPYACPSDNQPIPVRGQPGST